MSTKDIKLPSGALSVAGNSCGGTGCGMTERASHGQQDSQAALAELRREIDQVDAQIVALLNRRAALAIDVHRIKSSADIAVFAPAREREVLERIYKLADGGKFPKEALEKVFLQIMGASRALQQEQVVSYPGPSGSFSFLAGRQKFGGSVQFQPEISVANVVEKVARGVVNFGVVPMELEGGGLVADTLNAIMSEKHNTNDKLSIISEVYFETRLLLFSNGVNLERVQCIYGDAQMFFLAERWLSLNAANIKLEMLPNSDAVLARVKAEERAAGIVAEEVLDGSSLSTIARNIQDEGDQVKRFVVLGLQSLASSGKDKTSLICSMADRTGALRDVLQVLAANNISLTKIESKLFSPISGEYLFYVDILGHVDDPAVDSALSQLAAICLKIIVLGSYPRERLL